MYQKQECPEYFLFTLNNRVIIFTLCMLLLVTYTLDAKRADLLNLTIEWLPKAGVFSQ